MCDSVYMKQMPLLPANTRLKAIHTPGVTDNSVQLGNTVRAQKPPTTCHPSIN